MTKINDYHFPALDWDSDGGAVFSTAWFAHDSALEGDGFEPVWGFSCQVVVFGLFMLYHQEAGMFTTIRYV
jgi:hypothetical protein